MALRAFIRPAKRLAAVDCGGNEGPTDLVSAAKRIATGARRRNRASSSPSESAEAPSRLSFFAVKIVDKSIIPHMGYTGPVRDLVWLGTTRKDVREFPRRVQRGMGYALFLAQSGDRHPDAKPLRGFGGAGVLEIVERFDGDTYRAFIR